MPQLSKVQGVVFECGPWTGCRDWHNGGVCVQAASQMVRVGPRTLVQLSETGLAGLHLHVNATAGTCPALAQVQQLRRCSKARRVPACVLT